MDHKGIVIWVLWVEKNYATFNETLWSQKQVYHIIWLKLVDYGRNSWIKTQVHIKPSLF
uniref:Uncharacterized protein n=1 Tax=Physcomitrium patens TaxID=3218 RepID=A0A2K1J0Z6_PHYPA|nr:hypothetical protein PHYPA_023094 [Physcomitrium patens]